LACVASEPNASNHRVMSIRRAENVDCPGVCQKPRREHKASPVRRQALFPGQELLLSPVTLQI
jgi:hypothetical protein